MATFYGESSSYENVSLTKKRSSASLENAVVTNANPTKIIKVAIRSKRGEIWHEEVLEPLRKILEEGKESKPLVLAENVSKKRYYELCNICPDIFQEFKTHWEDKIIYVTGEPSAAHESGIDFFVDCFKFQAGQGVFENAGQIHVYDAVGNGLGADGAMRFLNQGNAANNNCDGTGTPYPVIFIEIHISRTLQHLHDLCSRLAAINNVNGVIGIKCMKKTTANNFRAVYYYYDGVTPNVPIVATSFGTLSLTNDNIDKINRVTGIAIANIDGYIAGGPAAGQVTAAQPHPINIPWNSIYNGTNIASPAGNLTFNLFDLQQRLRNRIFNSLPRVITSIIVSAIFLLIFQFQQI